MTTLGVSISWPEVVSSDSIQENWNTFQLLVHKAITQYVPTTTSKPNKSPPLWSTCLSTVINAKHAAF